MESAKETHEDVKEYYGKTLTKSTDLKTDACCPKGKGLYKSAKQALDMVHEEVIEKYYGCGNPIPENLDGCTILDLGSGTGRDVFIASKLVGKNGKVIGIDMTQEQIDVANKFRDYHAEAFGYEGHGNTEFIKGFIEDFTDQKLIEENSVDLVISNCVVNLSPNKDKVFTQVWKALKEGGEFYFSDIYSDRRVPKEMQDDKVLWGECLSGALYFEDFRRLMNSIGFKDLRVISMSPVKSKVASSDPASSPKFYSITIRAFKISEQEDRCENYQNTVTYLGGITDFEDKFELDKNYIFIKDISVSVCKNTAVIFRHSRYSRFFKVSEDQAHLGLHKLQSFQLNTESGLNKSCCSEKSGCCDAEESKSDCCKSKDNKSCCAAQEEKSGCCEVKQDSECCKADSDCCQKQSDCCKSSSCCDSKCC